MKPDFSTIKYNNVTPSRLIENTTTWMTAEQIEVKNQYTKADIETIKHLDFAAGIAPNLRGPYSTMDNKAIRWF